jgi:predicted secreted hydrolase
LRAAEGEVALDLVLEEGKPVVLQGDRGLSRKGPEPGNASYYYSLTRMPARGSVRLGADTLRTAGLAWLDREWSTSALSEGEVGWDWFALQLDGGWELMLYRLRRADGSSSPFSRGTLVDPEGGAAPLEPGRDVVVEATGSWSAPDGATYPSGWRVVLPARGWTLAVDPLLEDQELTGAFRYWEGAVRVTPETGGAPAGRGYVELTGYAGEPPTG